MNTTASEYIHKLIPESLDAVPFHSQVKWIERLVANNLPYHLAVHKITGAEAMPYEYVEMHNHSYPEINIILGDDDSFEFKVHLGNNVYQVKSPSTIWIPAGMDHFIVAVNGSGYYICLILKENANITYESLTGPSEETG
jgi:quercetin dioxygenase-like cupin family protein